MTMPHERTRSLRWGFELLHEMLLDESIDIAIRDAAQRLLLTYPRPDQISQLIEANASALPREASYALVNAGALWVRLRRSGQGTAVTRRSLLFCERHFPEPWVVGMLGKASIDGVRSWLLTEDHNVLVGPV